MGYQKLRKKAGLEVPEPGLFGMRGFVSSVPAAKGVENNDYAQPDCVDGSDTKAAADGRMTKLERAEAEIGRPKAL